MSMDPGAKGSLKADINVTPLVDVMSRSRFYVNLVPVTAGDLVPRVQRALQDKAEKLVYVKGDKDAKYSAVMDAMEALRKAQIENIALITERKTERARTDGGR